MSKKPTYEELEKRVQELEKAEIERTNADIARHENENRFKLMFMNAPLPYQSLDERGNFIAVNEAFLNTLGYTREELIGRNFGDFLHPDWVDHFKENFPKFKAIGEVLGVEFEMVRKDGSIILVSFDGKIQHDDLGNFQRTHCIFHNITEDKRKLEAIRESETLFRTLVDGAPEGIFVQSDGRFLFLNPAITRFLGANQADDLLGTELMARIAPEYHEAVRSRIRFQRETGKPAPPMDQEFVRLDGSRIPVETSAVAIRFQGHDAHLVFVRDRTARCKAEEERERLQAQLLHAQKIESVGRLAGGVAHDFNNMLMAILGNAEIAMEAIDPSTLPYTNLQEIYTCAQRSADLTRQLLAFARKQTINPQILNLNELVSGMIKMLLRLIGEDIELVWKPAANLWPVKMDPSQVDQILVNFTVNARDAITGVGNLTIETENVAFDETYCMSHAGITPGEYVLLAVSDTGCGIEKSSIEHLFEPFYTTKDIGKGTGLGLSTIYGIVKQNDGFINVYSEPGQGTTFKIYFPRIQVEDITETKGTIQKPAQGTETVLLVEDEPSILVLGKAILERYGYKVLAVRTPEEAQKLAEQYEGQIHLLITDVVMPQMNGRDLMVRIITSRPEIKTLYMSGYTTDVIAHHGVLEEGINFLQKPFSNQTLAAKVREVLDGSDGM